MMKEQQIIQLSKDIIGLYERDIRQGEKALESQLMRQRQTKTGEFKHLGRKQTLRDLSNSQLFSLHRYLLLDWMHFQTRCVVPLPRTTIRSKRLRGVSLDVLDEIETDFQTGKSLRPRVSRDVLKKLKTRKLREDPLLWHWNVHHFHLGEMDQNLGYNIGTNDLLFVYVDAERAVLIGIGTHDDFGKRWILRTLLTTAPDLADKFEMRGINGVSGNQNGITTIERNKILKSSNLIFEFRGRYLMGPGQGVTSSSHALRLVRAQDELFRHIAEWDKQSLIGQSHYQPVRLTFNSVQFEIINSKGKTLSFRPLI
jgi:hypothetical protein